MKKVIKEQGITLVALVVTILILLILAGVTLNLTLGERGLIEKVKQATKKYEDAQNNEIKALNKLGDILIDSNNKENEDIIEKIKVGDKVSYTAESSKYIWKAKYASIDLKEDDDDVVLDNTKDFLIKEWKIFSIDEKNRKIELIPATLTTGTVRLQGPQGYNNGVKLLNDACSTLYKNDKLGIEARSINRDDLEKAFTEETVQNAKDNNGIGFNNQGTKNSKHFSKYPIIYGQEKLSVINDIKNEKGLTNNEQYTFIERENEEGTDGCIQAESVQPYNTHLPILWDFKNNECIPLTKENFKQPNSSLNYYDLILMNGADTKYWIATRTVFATNSLWSNWVINIFMDGMLRGVNLWDCNNIGENSASLCPILTVNIDIIKENGNDGSYIILE